MSSAETDGLNIEDAISTAANIVRGSKAFGPHISRDDLVQEGWLHFLEHPQRYSEGDAEYQQHNAVRLLCQVMFAYARREKAAALGYDVKDEFFYFRDLIVEVLSSIVMDEYEPPRRERVGPNTTDPAEGGDHLAIRADIARAWQHAPLSERQRQALIGCYVDGKSEQEVADELGITQQSAHVYIERGVQRMIDFLGGSRPREGEEWIDRRLRKRPGGNR